MTDLEGGVFSEDRDVVSDRHVGSRGCAFGPNALLTHLVPDPQPHPRSLGAGGLAEQRGHPRQDVVEGVGLANPLAELGQHLVRRRSLPVDEPVREPLSAGANEEEDGGQDRADRDRRSDVAADPHEQDGNHQHHEPDPGHQPDEDDAVLEGLLHHDVEIPEAVPEDRHQVGGGHADDERERRQREEQLEDRRVGVAEQQLPCQSDDPLEDEARAGDRRHEGDPAHLLPLLAGGALEALADRDHRGERRREGDHGSGGDDRGRRSRRARRSRTGSRRGRRPRSSC